MFNIHSRKVLAIVIAALLTATTGPALAAVPGPDAVVRIAELDIDPAQLANFKVAVEEEMRDAIRLEPGVLAIYSVAEKGDPNRLHFFEIYANDAAYQAHRLSPHFKKYVSTTQPMIRSRKLIETDPVLLSAKP